jgi:hypothetical protein
MNLNRRTFLKTTAVAGGGLMIGGYLPNSRPGIRRLARRRLFEPNIWLKVNTDDTVRIMLTQLEMPGRDDVDAHARGRRADMDWSKIKPNGRPPMRAAARTSATGGSPPAATAFAACGRSSAAPAPPPARCSHRGGSDMNVEFLTTEKGGRAQGERPSKMRRALSTCRDVADRRTGS